MDMTTGEKALAEAIRYIGYTEHPAGSNKTAFGMWFGVNAAPWCAIFVSYCFKVGAGYTIAAGYKAAGMHDRGGAYVPTIQSWLVASKQWLGRVRPLPGDIAIFNWDGKGEPEHIGIVEKAIDDNTFICIEGNTSLNNNSNGGEVMRRTRTLQQVDGFGRILG